MSYLSEFGSKIGYSTWGNIPDLMKTKDNTLSSHAFLEKDTLPSSMLNYTLQIPENVVQELKDEIPIGRLCN